MNDHKLGQNITMRRGDDSAKEPGSPPPSHKNANSDVVGSSSILARADIRATFPDEKNREKYRVPKKPSSIITTSRRTSENTSIGKRVHTHDEEVDGNDPLSKRANALSIKQSFDILKKKVDINEIIKTGSAWAHSSIGSFCCGVGGEKCTKKWSEEEMNKLIQIVNNHIGGKRLPSKKRFSA